MRGTQQWHETPHRPGTPPITGARFPGSRFADSNITDRRRLTAAPSSPSQMEQQTQLRLDMESAELDTRIAEAQEKAAMPRRNTKLERGNRREGTRPGGTKYTRSYLTCSGRGYGFSPTGTVHGGLKSSSARCGSHAPALGPADECRGRGGVPCDEAHGHQHEGTGGVAGGRKAGGGSLSGCAGRRSYLRFDRRLGGGLARPVGDAHGLA